MWWCGPLPRLLRPHTFVEFFGVVIQQTATFLGVRTQGPVGPMTPKFELGREFCTLHITAKFHHPTFNRSEVIVLTDKQTN